jgi:hypothetical protein
MTDALKDILSAYVLGISIRFEFIRKLWAAFFNDATICEDVYEIWLDVLQDSGVVRNEQNAMVIGLLGTNNTF